MSMLIDSDIYDWLKGFQLVKGTQLTQKLPSDKIMLEESVSNQFLNGTIFAKLFQKLASTHPKLADKDLLGPSSIESINSVASPTSKLYNWNIIYENLKKLGINIDKDVKALIAAGDNDMINDILREIYKKYKKTNTQEQSMKPKKLLERSIDIQASVLKSPNSSSVTFHSAAENEIVDVTKMNLDIDLSQTQGLLEFVLVSVANSMNLSAPQTAQMLSENHKYLAHVIAKGIKEVFEPVITWLSVLTDHADHLVSLIAKESDKTYGIEFIHHILKAGLVSKDYDVAQKSCVLFTTLAYKYLNHNLLTYAWQWFISQRGGLAYILKSIRRHPDIIEVAIGMIFEYSRFNLIELFTDHLKKFHADDRAYLTTIRCLLKPLSESSTTHDEILNAGIVDNWIDFAMKRLEDEFSLEISLLATVYLCDLWLAYPIKIGENETQAIQIITNLKKMIYKGNKPARTTSIAQLFRLLEQFTTTKNVYAPAVYKVLVSSMVDHFSNSEMREFFVHNFKSLFSAGDSIPIGVVLEPLLKYLQSAEATADKKLNLFDLEFLSNAAKSSKLSLKHVIQLLDIFAKVYLNNIIYAGIAGKALIRLFASNLESEQIQDYGVKLVEVSLAIFYSSEKSKRPKERILPNYNSKHVNSRPFVPNTELEHEIMTAQKRSLVIELIKNIINLGNSGINNQVKTLLLLINQQLSSNLNTEHKGISMLISLYGNSAKIIAEFEKKKKGGERKTSGERKTGERKDFRQNLSPLPIKKSDEPKKTDFLKSPGTASYDFFKELGIVPKMKVTKPERPKPTTDLSFLRIPKADPKVLEKIAEIQKSFTDKTLKRKEDIEAEKNIGESRVRRLSDVSVPFTKKHYALEGFLFQENSQEAEKVIEKRQFLTHMAVVHLEKEEDRETKGVRIVLKKYSKAIKNLFKEYAHSENIIRDPNVIQSKFEVVEKHISMSEVWKMLKDHDLSTLVSYEELAALLRLTNVEIMKDSSLKWLTLEGFKNLIVQLAVFIYSRSTEDTAHMPIFFQVQELILKFRETDAKKGENTIFYDDPDRTNPGDPEVNKHLNQILKEDPDHEIPDAYRKYKVQDLAFNYSLNPTLQVTGSYRTAYEILDEILFSNFKVHLIEPVTSYLEITKAKFKVIAPIPAKLYQIEPFAQRPIEEAPKDYYRRFTKEAAGSPQVKFKGLFAKSNHDMSLVLKEEVIKQKNNERYLYSEVALVLEDICESIDKNKPYHPVTEPLVVNRVEKERLQQQEKEKKEHEEAELKRKNHSKYLKEKLKAMIQQKAENAPKGLTEEQQKAAAQTEKKRAELKKYYGEQKEKASTHQEKTKMERKAKEEEEKQNRRKEQELKRKQFQEFNAKKIAELTERYRQMRERQLEMERNQQTKGGKTRSSSQNGHDYNAKIMEGLKKEIAKYEKQKKDDAEIHSLIQKKEISDIFEKNKKALKRVYDWYCLATHHPLGELNQSDTLLLKPYMVFGREFMIYPTIISAREVEGIFRTLTKVKPTVAEMHVSLTFEDFEEALVRIAIKGQVKFEELYNARTGKGINNANLTKSKNEIEKDDSDEGDEQEDKYEKINAMTANTLQGLLFYLDLPSGKQALYNKLNELRGQKISIKEKKQKWKKMLDISVNNNSSNFDDQANTDKLNSSDDE